MTTLELMTEMIIDRDYQTKLQLNIIKMISIDQEIICKLTDKIIKENDEIQNTKNK